MARSIGLDRRAIVRMYKVGMGYREIARELGCTHPNVIYHIRRWKRDNNPDRDPRTSTPRSVTHVAPRNILGVRP